jgi:hypothetical protein
VSERPKNAEPIGESVHIWMEANERDVVMFFGCIGGPRDGSTFGVPVDRGQARAIANYISAWLAARP